jgi:hypothetical protein
METLKSATLFWICLLAWSSNNCGAQEREIAKLSNKRNVWDALKTVDDLPSEELDWVSPFLEKTIAEEPSNAIASSTLALIQLRAQDFDAVSETLKDANETELGGITRSTNGKLRLLCAINLEDKESANRLFDALVGATQKESISLTVRKSYCEWLGEIIGTIESDEARSPIAKESLTKAKKTLLGTAEVVLSDAFKSQFERANSRAERTRSIIAKHRELGEDGLIELRTKLEDQITKMEEDLSDDLQEKRDFVSENLAATKEVRLGIANNRDRYKAVEREWAQTTPGLPYPVPAPIPPQRELIYVDPYQFRWVTRIVNGRVTEYQIQELRPSWDVEAERDSIYRSQFSFYSSQLELYKSYQREFAEWKKSDTKRRNDLQKVRQEIEDENATLRTQLAQLEKDRKENRGGLAPVKKSISQLKEELQTILDVQRAIAIGRPEMALRPIRIDRWLITEEKNRLVRLGKSVVNR